ncbi:MAG: transglutaminase, partial [Cyanobacteria bacterium J06639_18]
MLDFSRITRFWRLPLNNFWQQHSQKSPPKQVEDSVTLRVLVLALVIVAIIAIDIAAKTTYSFWGLPLSIVGAIWSYYHRHQRNITIKFFIAIGMLVA